MKAVIPFADVMKVSDEESTPADGEKTAMKKLRRSCFPWDQS